MHRCAKVSGRTDRTKSKRGNRANCPHRQRNEERSSASSLPFSLLIDLTGNRAMGRGGAPGNHRRGRHWKTPTRPISVDGKGGDWGSSLDFSKPAPHRKPPGTASSLPARLGLGFLLCSSVHGSCGVGERV